MKIRKLKFTPINRGNDRVLDRVAPKIEEDTADWIIDCVDMEINDVVWHRIQQMLMGLLEEGRRA